ncbi:hypothetical protein [Actinomadura sp. WAC 06369]|uniref:hypothetical protein n=1 Tax=Actinomadura sp. WAC 06369 TaxID=2203193 RepID=UPI000F775440|nr:hypothetical protein [Actinomadura sp. WAC 06369]
MEWQEESGEIELGLVGSTSVEEDRGTGNLTKLHLTKLGSRPYRCPEIVTAWWRLRSTYESVTGLFDTLYLVRRTRASTNNSSTRGRLSSDAQDLLRAAIVFTSAGVDASMQALIEYAAPSLILHNETAKKRFEVFVDQQVRAPKVADEFVSALKHRDPHDQMVQLYIASLTRASFQGSGDLRDRAAGALGISNKQIPKGRFTALNPFFAARNEVAHHLDLQNGAAADAKPPRIPRTQEAIGPMCNEALLMVCDLIKATAANLSMCRTR